MRGGAAQAAIASGVNHTVRLPRARRPASYSAQLVTQCRCFGMWRRQAALALNGTAEIQASGKGPSSYTAQLPTPTGRSMQQGGDMRLASSNAGNITFARTVDGTFNLEVVTGGVTAFQGAVGNTTALASLATDA